MYNYIAILSAMDEMPDGCGLDEEYLLGGENSEEARKNLVNRMEAEGYKAEAIATNKLEVAVQVGSTEIVYLVIDNDR